MSRTPLHKANFMIRNRSWALFRLQITLSRDKQQIFVTDAASRSLTSSGRLCCISKPNKTQSLQRISHCAHHLIKQRLFWYIWCIFCMYLTICDCQWRGVLLTVTHHRRWTWVEKWQMVKWVWSCSVKPQWSEPRRQVFWHTLNAPSKYILPV